MKHYLISAMALILIASAILAAMGLGSGWSLQWDLNSGKQRMVKQTFFFPHPEPEEETVLSRWLGKPSLEPEWKEVASWHEFLEFLRPKMLVSYCYLRIQPDLRVFESEINILEILDESFDAVATKEKVAYQILAALRHDDICTVRNRVSTLRALREGTYRSVSELELVLQNF